MTVMLGLIVAMFASGWVGSAAVATPPVTLNSDFVTDEAGVLSSGELDAANARLGELASANGGDLYVVFVDEFTDPVDSVDWTDQVAADNGLGPDQYLIAVALDSGQYAISADASGPLSDSQIDAVVQAMENGLRARDWDGAVIAAADAFPGQAGQPGDAGGFVGILIALVVVAVVVIVIVMIVRSRKKKKDAARPTVPDPNDPYAVVSDDDLEKQAGSALVQADDAITSSRQEVGFAVAQYGEDSTAAFTQVVEAAQAKIAEAFALKQQIDDEVPDTAEQRRAWHIQIIQLCDAADDLLDENIEAFEELRKLEAEAPQALERLTARRAAAQQLLTAAPAALAALSQNYDAAALSTVAENPAQAQQRLSLADSEMAAASQLIAAGNSGEAAFAIRTAEAAVQQSEELTAAVTSLGANLSAVEEQARALIADLEADLAAAAAMPDSEAQLAPLIARTRANIDSAQESLQASRRNPQQVLETLDSANTQIDAALGQAREASAVAQRTQRMLQQRLTQAQAQISAATDFITTRRGAIGATARTRLAEANAAYSEAVATQATDPALATERATRAANLAGEAISYAQSEVSSFNNGGWGGSNGGWGGSNGGWGGSSGGSGLGGDILGGILGGLLSGGGGSGRSSGGGWSGGSSWRSSGSSRSSRPSSFGGGSRSGGRSRGGRF
ncbi:TPM domain-containing protein [Microbacterium profundi]|uniref:TPM domain-containing protein n=1 Tax=Microbacterium profundi TaxID=450380 RepID=UPI001F3AEB40|nr:TPM domain-containing protein [Microbacterium profundi]MCE7480411.1 TPM domain-containing protein [Microbacterium profundi]